MAERSSRRRSRPHRPTGAVPAGVAAGSGASADPATGDGEPLARASTLTQPERPPVRRSRPGTEAPAAPLTSTVSAPVEAPALSAARRPVVPLETVLFLGLVALAVLTRFWDLGSRALHHDESLHTYYSWLFATDGRYVHDPLMHGPFLFHANALVYLLLGDSDATSRYMPALFGTVLVGLPYLLRGPRLLGRWGALAASALFLVSPSLLYYSRYIRHDLYTVVGSLLLFTAIVRYLERPERRWLVLAAGSLGFLLTNHEIVFAIAFVFVAFLWGALLWGRLRPLLLLHVGAGALAAAGLLTVHRLARPLPAIPWGEFTPPTRDDQLAYYRELLTHPLVLAVLGLAVAFVVAARMLLAPHRDPDLAHEGWIPSLFAGAPSGSVERAVLAAWVDRVGLLAAFATGGIIFVALFTTLFTNPGGLATGTIATDGTLLYWLGQQGVQRGEQPWFYFLIEAPQYEFLALAFGLPALVLVVVRTVRYLLERRADPDVVPHPRLRFQLFAAVWFGLIFLGLSYAGEKMPWLIVHFTLPLILLAAGLAGELAERWAVYRNVAADDNAKPTWRWAEPALVAGLLALGGGWLLLAGRLSYPEWIRPANGGGFERTVSDWALDRWWWLLVPPLAAVGLLAAGWLLRGPRATGRAATVALVVGLLVVQTHVSWRMSFLEGDVARDTLIYNTTTPDVTRMVRELGVLSAEMTGGKGLDIWFDNCTSWPLNWYLRNFTNRHYFNSPGVVPADAPVVIVGNDPGECPNVAGQLDGYAAQPYVLRWHEPEHDVYRRFAIAPELPPSRSAWGDAENPHGLGAIIGSVIDSLATQTTPEGQQRLWRLIMYRELPSPTTNYGYTLYVRSDLVPLFNTIRY